MSCRDRYQVGPGGPLFGPTVEPGVGEVGVDVRDEKADYSTFGLSVLGFTGGRGCPSHLQIRRKTPGVDLTSMSRGVVGLDDRTLGRWSRTSADLSMYRRGVP